MTVEFVELGTTDGSSAAERTAACGVSEGAPGGASPGITLI